MIYLLSFYNFGTSQRSRNIGKAAADYNSIIISGSCFRLQNSDHIAYLLTSCLPSSYGVGTPKGQRNLYKEHQSIRASNKYWRIC